MKIVYIPPKTRKKKKCVILFNFAPQILASLFMIKDPQMVVLIICILLLAAIAGYMQIQENRKEAKKKREDAEIKAHDHQQKLNKVRGIEPVKEKVVCSNVSVKSLL